MPSNKEKKATNDDHDNLVLKALELKRACEKENTKKIEFEKRLDQLLSFWDIQKDEYQVCVSRRLYKSVSFSLSLSIYSLHCYF